MSALTDIQRMEFAAVTEPVIKWLNDNCHPHHNIIITPDSAELSEGQLRHATTAYIKD